MMTAEIPGTRQKYQLSATGCRVARVSYFWAVREKFSTFFKDHWLIFLALAFTIICYAQFFSYGSISWDDPEMVFRNADVKRFDASDFFTSQYVGNYIPFTMLAHALAYLSFGNKFGLHHLLNILLHITNGILLYQLCGKLKLTRNAAALVAGIFLLHPLQVESVGWISELKTVLYVLFTLCGFIVYLEYKSSGGRFLYPATFILFVASCLCKPSAVVFPLSLLCFDLFLSGRITVGNITTKIPFFIIALVFGVINIIMQKEAQFINYSHAFPYPERTGMAGFALLMYLKLFLLPVKLSVIYPYPDVNSTSLVTGFLFLIAVAVTIFFFLRRRKQVFPAIILFIIVNLALVLQFIPFGEVLYADRYMYLPLAGFALILAIAAEKYSLAKPSVILAILLILSASTFGRSQKWKDALTLYEDILKKYPQSFIALNSAGVECMRRDLDTDALSYFNKAVASAPRNYKGYYNRGLLYLKQNRPKEAIESFDLALGLHRYVKAYTGRAAAYYQLADIEKAMADAREALALDPGNARAHFVLANSYNEQNLLKEAINEYNNAIALSEEADFYFKRAIALGKQQEFVRSIADLNHCLELNPFYSEAYYWRGVAKVNLRQNPCDDFREAVHGKFEHATAAYNKYCR
jgi:protein O-mannosyl-transferase